MSSKQNIINQELQRGLARADYARYLSACYYQPEALFFKEKMFDSMIEVARFLEPDLVILSEKMRDDFTEDRVPLLLVEYTKLFLGPSDVFAKPYASVWQEGSSGSLMQDSTMALLDLYKDHGFVIAEDVYAPPDHIALQLEFLYLLLFKHTELMSAQKTEDEKYLREQCEQFLLVYIKNWFLPFTEYIDRHAVSSFYKSLAQATKIFIYKELASIDS